MSQLIERRTYLSPREAVRSERVTKNRSEHDLEILDALEEMDNA